MHEVVVRSTDHVAAGKKVEMLVLDAYYYEIRI
jgi:hypothetical protein